MTAAKTCLIVDDSEVIRELAQRLFADFGLEAVAAADAPAALDICREKKIAAVFLDWDLPSMGALDFLHGAAGLSADAKPAIVLCATENDPQQFTLAKAAGAAHHVLKPFDRVMISAKLADIGLIDRASEPQAARR
ncbi:MAG: response regulator [Parvularculaceae bacterium]